MTPLRTEADLLRTLATGVYTVSGLYRMAEAVGLADRPGGRRVIQDGKEQYKRRVRSALQALKRQGRARPAEGRAAWLIDGTPERPRARPGCAVARQNGDPGRPRANVVITSLRTILLTTCERTGWHEPEPNSTDEPHTATTLLLTRHSATPTDTG